METLLDDWGALKPTTSFGELPLLTTPDLGDIAHELAILNYIGRKTSLGGADDKEFCISGQLMQMAEDIFQKLVQVQPSFMDAKAAVVAAGTTADFWANTKLTEHNSTQVRSRLRPHLNCSVRSKPPSSSDCRFCCRCLRPGRSESDRCFHCTAGVRGLPGLSRRVSRDLWRWFGPIHRFWNYNRRDQALRHAAHAGHAQTRLPRCLLSCQDVL